MQWLQSMTCDVNQFATLEQLIGAERHRLVHAHLAPSRGTASRARDRPVPGMVQLNDTEAARVKSANDSCNAAVELILIFLELGVPVSIENLKNSCTGALP